MCDAPQRGFLPDGWDFGPEFLDDPAHLPPHVPYLDSPVFGVSRRPRKADLQALLPLESAPPTPPERRPHTIVLPGVFALIDDREAGRNRLLGPSRLVLGEELQNRHWLWIGPPGTGKTSQGILPLTASLLADATRSLIVFDPKGDQFGVLRDLAIAAGRPARRVLRLNLTDPRGSIGWNPLRRGLTRTEALAVASTLVTASENRQTQDSPFWRNVSIELIVDILLGLDRDPKDTLTLPRVLEIVNLPRAQLLEWMQSHGVHKFAAFLESGSQNAETCLADTGMRLLALFDLDLCAVLSHAELQIADLFRRPTVLVVEMSEARMDRLRPIFNMLVQQILDQAIAVTESRPDARLPFPVSLVIDEFGSAIGAIPRFPIYLNTLRSRRVGITAAVQSLSQIRSLYGADAGAVLAGFSSKVFFPNCEPDDAEVASRASGTMAVAVPAPEGEQTWAVRRVLLSEEIVRARPHPVLGRPVTMLIADELVMQCYLPPSYRQPRFRDVLRRQQQRRSRTLRRRPLTYVPREAAGTQAPFTSTSGLTTAAIALRLGNVEAKIDLGRASVSAQEYWTGLRATHRRALSHMLRLAEEIAARDATVEDYHRSLRECGSTVAEVALKYLDYTTARRRHERTKDG
ncbi:MAG: type IV secretion system DNA-binding domain-containing protein [Planctomycetes bacterium]|nr:type IV secretion system DNA-binding domain-containing protein [Planctomycetota bacterium]